MHLASVQEMPGVETSFLWGESIPVSERVGMLFQGAVLVDTLTVGENIALGLALLWGEKNHSIRRETGGVSTANIGGAARAGFGEVSWPTQWRYAQTGCHLAQLLSQGKRLIILDEPFVGLDPDTAVTIALELKRIRDTCGTAFLLISHIKEYADLLKPDVTLTVEPAIHSEKPLWKWRFPQLHFAMRFLYKLGDYFLLSLPLVIMAFIAAGFAISLLFADMIEKTEVTDDILELIDEEFTDAEIPGVSDLLNNFILAFIRAKVEELVGDYVPDVKEEIFATGCAKLFVIEIGPLLTALLLAGRIGGSYAGEVGTMQATNQNRLLKTLGTSPRGWTLGPTTLAAILAMPSLTILGTLMALWCGSIAGRMTKVADTDVYW
eukprot:CAMPEP_0117781364 /NCGR_PEP_ID=MMETSP0948-20121206/2798_1 /TAXON_ID=44440 /ORGANISM="Chattonella subsalsa, Strain CCMP2191" /LENGTH=378 /DNA_ID=CAMNT_0005609373 /DNA_START=553 /DNA_END=1687 /DNA_ORIENTATION=-